MAGTNVARDDGAGPRLIAGAMSGTSADGVDVALVQIGGTGLQMTARLLRHHHRPYDAALKRAIFAARAGDAPLRLSDLASLGRSISLAYATTVNEAFAAAGVSTGDVEAVAAHGQTLHHAPPDTIQWLDPALLAAETGCAVVSDFRRADCAAGGQGAPLVPFADYILFRDPEKGRVLLNIGGIANLTYIAAGAGIEQVIAFDTGPGNCVSDWLCRTRDPSGPGYDVDGAGAARGSADFGTAFVAARSRYVFRRPPKSTDGPEMIGLYEEAKGMVRFAGTFEDELATACAVSAHAVGMSLELFVPGWREGGPGMEVLVSGGGVRNPVLMAALRERIGGRAGVRELDPVTAQAKEAVAFALLGAATLDGEPGNVPSCTGARRRVVLGSITPRP